MAYLGNAPTEVPLSSADLQDSIVTSAKIANGTIALADLSATGSASASTFLRGDNSWASAGATAGQVIQVLSATDSTSRSTTSTSYVTASNTLSVTITPSSASNKILLIFSSAGQSNADIAYYTIYRDSSNLSAGATGFTLTYDGTDGYNSLAMSYLDSPNTTSAITYQVYFKGTGGITAVLNRSNVTGSLTCMEIKG